MLHVISVKLYPGSCFGPHEAAYRFSTEHLQRSALPSLPSLATTPVGAYKTQHLSVHNHCCHHTGNLHFSAAVLPLVKDLQRDKLAALAET